MSHDRIAVLGAGRLGETLIRGLIAADTVQPHDVLVTAAHAARVQDLEKRLGVQGAASNLEAVRNARLILLTVKPHQIDPVVREIAPGLTPEHLLISGAASASTAYIEARIGDANVPVVRAMPNTPAMLRLGMTAVCAGSHARDEHVNRARQIFGAVGRTVVVDEQHMDAVTGLSASGPAFIFIIIESLAEAGVKVGLPRTIATELAAQTVLGSGAMVIETGEHPAKLKDDVTTPGGTTIDGILELEDGGLRVTLIKAVVRATQRATARARELEGTAPR
jgi:pyrroline-5-carboxylate reductase